MFRTILIFTSLVLIGYSKSLVPIERTAIFSLERARDLLSVCYSQPEGISGFWSPEEKDLVGVEDHLEEYLVVARTKVHEDRKQLRDQTHYYRQVCGVLVKGERLLFISYAWAPDLSDPRIETDRRQEAERRGRRYDPDWWKNTVIAVCDGGSDFFRVMYDPKKKEFVWYEQNGKA